MDPSVGPNFDSSRLPVIPVCNTPGLLSFITIGSTIGNPACWLGPHVWAPVGTTMMVHVGFHWTMNLGPVGGLSGDPSRDPSIIV